VETFREAALAGLEPPTVADCGPASTALTILSESKRIEDKIRGKERGEMRRIVLLVMVALGLMALAAPAPAATRTPVTFTDTTISTGTPKRVWTSGGVLHVRGMPQTTAVSGDLTGTFSLQVNLNLDLATGTGELYGKFILTTSTVTWEGSFTAQITSTGASGKFIGQGSDGTKIIGTFTQISSTSFLNEAVILAPHG
jgi:hypothetical protein